MYTGMSDNFFKDYFVSHLYTVTNLYKRFLVLESYILTEKSKGYKSCLGVDTFVL